MTTTSNTPASNGGPNSNKGTVYITPLVHSLSLDILEFSALSALLVDGEGIIQWVEPLDSALPRAEREKEVHRVMADRGITSDQVELVWLDDGFLCPGLIDTHTHAPQYPNLGLGSDLQLLDWLERITFPTEVKFGNLEYAREVYEEVIRRSLNAGTTTSCYYATIHEESTKLLADLCIHLGQRAFVGKCNMDRNCPATYTEATESSIASTEAFLAHFDKPTVPTYSEPVKPSRLPLVQPILTPRFAISCTPSLLSSLAALSASRTPSIPIQTHMSENPLECAWVTQMFADETGAENWGKTYAGVYEHYGLLGPGTILAHCVHLDDEQREIIRRTGAGVSHCPGSNMFLSSGAAKIRELLDLDIKVGLGTDCSGGPSIGILSAIRSASYISKFNSFPSSSDLIPSPPRTRPLSTPNLFYLATMGGAALCRLEGSIGNFLPGKEFDALWVRPRGPGMFLRKGEGLKEIFEKWIWGGDDRDLGAVWVRGKRVAGTAGKETG